MIVDWWKQLADHRRAAKLTQAEVAAHFGFHPRTISRMENGEYSPRMHLVMSLLELYGISWRNAFLEPTETPEGLEGLNRAGATALVTKAMPKMTAPALRCLATLADELSKPPVAPDAESSL